MWCDRGCRGGCDSVLVVGGVVNVWWEVGGSGSERWSVEVVKVFKRWWGVECFVIFRGFLLLIVECLDYLELLVSMFRLVYICIEFKG